ncbi:ABC transporter substrate-binding protein [Nocardioides insulae]|uniref:ABC transporter substrate-binding protein n=1 Tax=Nocardioides insulae TaxID=394734 RepID=UPI00040CA561|nr:ABC transporter substrate-binding protein [Nocardioides insulae]
MRRTTVMLSTALLALTVAGCDAAADTSASKTAQSAVSVKNCGREVSVEGPPERVVSLNQGSTEILLSLGLGDRIVGTATWTDPILPSLAEANADIPRLAENAPSFEAVLAEEPDFVTASFVSTLGEGGVATRDQFEDLGVGTYIAPSDCVGKEEGAGDGTRTEPFTMESVYQEIEDLAEIFDVEEKGDELVADLQGRLAEATEQEVPEGTSALFWFANDESPYMAGCCGAPGVIANSLGLENVFDDTKDEWPQINWETVADRDPDVLVIGDLTRKSQTAETAEAKIEFLESNPVTREMDAVKNERYVVLTGAEMNPSLRTVYGAENVAAQLRALGLAG